MGFIDFMLQSYCFLEGECILVHNSFKIYELLANHQGPIGGEYQLKGYLCPSNPLCPSLKRLRRWANSGRNPYFLPKLLKAVTSQGE
jgi:hypothetical protein